MNTCSGKDLYLGVLTGEGQQRGGGQGILFPFHCSDETLTESSLGEESIYLAYCSRSRSITKGSQGRNSSRNLKQKAWRNTAWRLPHGSCSVSFLRQFRNTCPGNGAAHCGLGSSPSINNQHIPPTIDVYKPVLPGRPSTESPFPDNCRPCQVAR